MSTAQFTTPPSPAAIPGERVRVGFPMRFVADLIDILGVTIVNVIISFVLGGILAHIVGTIIAGILVALITSAIVFAYFSLEVVKAQSPGKMIFKLVITQQDGTPATRDQLIKRYAFKMVPALVGILGAIPLLGLVFLLIRGVLQLVIIVLALMYARENKLALYDEWFGTAVFGPATATAGFPVMPTTATAAPQTPPTHPTA